MGLRKKIKLGFLCLRLLLIFSGIVSFIELGLLSWQTTELVESTTYNLNISKKLLDAVQSQNKIIIGSFATGQEIDLQAYVSARGEFESVLSEATVTVNDLQELDSIYVAYDRYLEAVSLHLAEGDTNPDFVDAYLDSYNELNNAVKQYMIASQYSLASVTTQLRENAYRAITPEIITLGVCLAIIVIFGFLIDIYYSRPIENINRGLDDYIRLSRPYTVKINGKDEVHIISEYIADLIQKVRSGTKG